MRYYLDTEFIEQPNTIELLSIGLVAEDGREYYAVHTEADCSNADQWVKENVLMKMPEYNKSYNDLRSTGGSSYPKKTRADIRKEILHFCGQNNNAVEQCEFYGYYADYDWVVFCWIFGKMIHLPKEFPMYCRDLKQMLDEAAQRLLNTTLMVTDENLNLKNAIQYLKDKPEYPKQEIEHNALEDAKWNQKLHSFIISL